MMFGRFGAGVLGATIITAGLLVVGPTTEATAATAATAASKAPLVIGDICSCTGPEASSVAQTTPTIEAWAKYVSAHGGIQGHPVTIIVKDDGYNPTTSLAAAQTLVGSDHVAAIIDNSDVDTSWGPYVK